MYSTQMFVMYIISLGVMGMLGAGITEWFDKSFEKMVIKIEKRISSVR